LEPLERGLKPFLFFFTWLFLLGYAKLALNPHQQTMMGINPAHKNTKQSKFHAGLIVA
jgi:hypothetical protein